jgi:hypothetical protein
MIERGVFLPMLKNGWIISTTAPQYQPSYAMNEAMTQVAEGFGFSFVLSPVNYRGFDGPTEQRTFIRLSELQSVGIIGSRQCCHSYRATK